MSFYVYHLVDPRDGATFYVGKGTRERDAAHEREAGSGSAHPKCDRIRAIWEAGHQVERRRVAFFADEKAAYDFEAQEIERIGLENLTNQIPGGGSPRTQSDDSPLGSARDCRALLANVARFLRFSSVGGRLSGPWHSPCEEAVKTVLREAVKALGFDAVRQELASHRIDLVPADV